MEFSAETITAAVIGLLAIVGSLKGVHAWGKRQGRRSLPPPPEPSEAEVTGQYERPLTRTELLELLDRTPLTAAEVREAVRDEVAPLSLKVDALERTVRELACMANGKPPPKNCPAPVAAVLPLGAAVGDEETRR